MQFFKMRDGETKYWHNYLIIQLPKDEFAALKLRFDSGTAKLGCSAYMQGGRPCVVFEYGGSVDLGEVFGSGETLGDKLQVGDIVVAVLTDQSTSQIFTQSEGGLKLNLDLVAMAVYPFMYTKEMEALYEVYNAYTDIKSGDRQLKVKSNTKKTLFR